MRKMGGTVKLGGSLRRKFVWTISRKISALMLAVTVLSCAAVASFAALTSFSTTSHLIGTHLEYIASTKRDMLASKLEATKLDIESLAANPSMVQLFDRLSIGIKGSPADQIAALSGLKTEGKKLSAAVGKDMVMFIDSYQKMDDWLRSLIADRGYAGIFLISEDGNLIYSTGGEPFGAVEPKSTLKDALTLSEGRNRLVTTDFSVPSPGRQGQAIFAVAVADGFDPSKRGGTLLVALSTETIDRLLHDPTGFGPRGEALLAGDDGQLRSTSRLGGNEFSTIAHILLTRGMSFGTYRGKDVLAASQPLQWAGHDWTVVALEPQSAVFAPAMKMVWQIAPITAITALVTLVVAMSASRSISRPISHLVFAIKQLASGDTSLVLTGTNRVDEVGDMSRAVLIFRDNAIARIAAEEGAKRSQAAVESDRKITESARVERLRVQAEVVSQIGCSLSALAEGKLSRPIADNFPEDYQQLKDDFNNALGQLRTTIRSVSRQADSMSSIVRDLSHATIPSRPEPNIKQSFWMMRSIR